MAYYTLITRDNANGKWSPQFGDHKKDVVQMEYEDSYTYVKRSNHKIIKTERSSQKQISEIIDAMNGEMICR